MGAHKPSPEGEEEPIDNDLRAVIHARLAANKTTNDHLGIDEDDPRHRPGTHAELARCVFGKDKKSKSDRMLSKIIGPKGWPNHEIEIELVDSSRLVGRILDALEIPRPQYEEISVPSKRAAMLRYLARLTDDQYAMFANYVRDVRERLEAKK